MEAVLFITIWILVKTCEVITNKSNKMAEKDYLSKDPRQRMQQLALIIPNARIYNVEVKPEWLEEYGKLHEEVLGEKW